MRSGTLAQSKLLLSKTGVTLGKGPLPRKLRSNVLATGRLTNLSLQKLSLMMLSTYRAKLKRVANSKMFNLRHNFGGTKTGALLVDL